MKHLFGISTKKTDTTLQWLITIIVIVALSLILVVFASTNIEKLKLQQQISNKHQLLTTITIVKDTIAIVVNS
ncbi:MAG: hypothetical protein F6K62_19280 [Sphaerospermopsis sp. SIO1G2]|nr:hypothetical protein [Sphaerospermopsis sp. SIO1G2]